MPGIREIDTEILKSIRRFLGQFHSYIPVFFSNYGGIGNFWWPQITAGAVLVSHQKYLKAFESNNEEELKTLLKEGRKEKARLDAEKPII